MITFNKYIIYVRVGVCMGERMSVRARALACVYVFVCMCVYVCMYVCMCVYMYVCMCMFIYIFYIHLFTQHVPLQCGNTTR
jgi:hypothetical protein